MLMYLIVVKDDQDGSLKDTLLFDSPKAVLESDREKAMAVIALKHSKELEGKEFSISLSNFRWCYCNREI